MGRENNGLEALGKLDNLGEPKGLEVLGGLGVLEELEALGGLGVLEELDILGEPDGVDWQWGRNRMRPEIGKLKINQQIHF